MLYHRSTRRGALRALGLSGLALALAACGGGAPAPISTTPAGIAQLIADGGDILAKVDTIRQTLNADAQALLVKGKGLLTTLSATGSTSTASALLTTLAGLATFLPPPYGTIALAIQTLLPIMGGVIGLRAAAPPTGMTEAQARAIIRQR